MSKRFPKVYSFRLSEEDEAKLKGLFEKFHINVTGERSAAFRELVHALYDSSRPAAQSREAKGAGDLSERECVQCGKLFAPLVHAQRFCSPECYYKAHGVKPRSLTVKRWHSGEDLIEPFP